MTDEDPWLSPSVIAEEWDCSTDTVLRAVQRGDLPAFRYGRLIRIRRSDLDVFLARYRA